MRLMLILIAAGFLMYLWTGIFWILASDEKPHSILRSNIERYANFLIDEIGTPPDTSLARTLSSELKIDIKISQSNLDWSSRPNMKFPKTRHRIQILKTDNARADFHRGRFYINITRDQTDYLLAFNFQRNPGEHNSSLLILLAGIILIMIFTYHTIKKLLKPVRLLENGVQQVNMANFEYQVPVCSRDELGRLTVSFNKMILRIRDMIAAREQLLLDVSHELRSPLTRIKVALEKVKNQRVRHGIADDIREMETMVTEILESERLKTKHGGLHRLDTDLVSMVKAIVKQYNEQKPGVYLATSQAELLINVDPDRIQICLKNIIKNALKYSTQEADPVQIFLNSIADRVEIKIQDFGQGIPEADLKMVIEPFYRVDKSRTKATGGYGLGLNLCQKIIEAHGGNLNLISTVGQGTTVIITLPLHHRN